MSEQKIRLAELQEAFAPSLGIEAATKLLREALMEVGLRFGDSYTVEDAILICSALKARPGFIGVIANILLQRYRESN